MGISAIRITRRRRRREGEEASRLEVWDRGSRREQKERRVQDAKAFLFFFIKLTKSITN